MYIYKYRYILKQKDSNNSRLEICQIFWLQRGNKCEYHRHRFSLKPLRGSGKYIFDSGKCGQKKCDACIVPFELNIAGGMPRDYL